LKDKFKTSPLYVLPILVSLLFGLLCAYAIRELQMAGYTVTPFQEGVGSFGNGLYFVVLAGVGASLLYLLLKRRGIRSVILVVGTALTVAVFMLSVVYLYTLFSMFTIPYTDATVLMLSVFITIVADFAVFGSHSRISTLAILLLGGALGAFLGILIGTLSAILILVFLAIYDVFTVYHGPVGKIAKSGLDQLKGLSFSFRNVQMGLGDLTFYSMLTSRVLVDGGPWFWLGSTAGVLLGVFLAFKMLEKRGMFPGLPFPIALGLIPLILSLHFS
jgi:presenilin-like A22 family membrane protease